MSLYAVVVQEELWELAHEVAAEDLEGTVNDILDEAGTSTIIMECACAYAFVEDTLWAYLGKGLRQLISIAD